MLALVWVNHEGQLAELLLDFLWRGVKMQVQLLKRIELEGPKDSVDLIITVDLFEVGEEGLRTRRSGWAMKIPRLWF